MTSRKEFKLYVTTVDFSEAYDKVSRAVMIHILKHLGRGVTMLLALVVVYDSAIMSTTVGVRQESPTSCLLFVIFVTDPSRLIKQNCDMEGFLAWLHLVVLMDDAVLLSANGENMIKRN